MISLVLACVVSAVWQLVSRELPFAGLHHGEVIHRVVTEDLRPGDGQWGYVHERQCLCLQHKACSWHRLAQPSCGMMLQLCHRACLQLLRLCTWKRLQPFPIVLHLLPHAVMLPCAGPWPAGIEQTLPGYVSLAEACWARQAAQRPTAQQVLQQLLTMLEHAEATN